jgi:riboflavin kinase/FMN adenylyltransferase
VTFAEHPQNQVAGKSPSLITGVRDRERLLYQRFSMDTVVTLHFDAHMRTLPWQEFIEMLLRDYDAAGFVCGEDFRFGYKGQGNAPLLSDYCGSHRIPCSVVPEQTIDGIRVSSTYIRRQIEDGDMETAVRFLGHPHILSGEVVSGRKIGRTIGVPTANVLIPEGVVLPKWGVYACLCRVDGETYMAVTNIGSRPTVEGHQVRAESWILDFEGDLYGKEITLEFRNFLRPEQKFVSLEELRAQIQKDAAQTRILLR